MIRCCLLLTCLAVSLMSIGCCGPMGCGQRCHTPMGCNDCDGCETASYPAMGPLDGLRNFKRRVMCGAGCGETYVGEWISTPPDAQDPCCGTEFVGGAVKCRPFSNQFCWEPGALVRKLYGGRFCDGAASSVECGCEGVCDGGCGATMIEGTVEGGTVSTSSAGCGCASCSSPGMAGMRAAQRPAIDPVTRSRTMDSRAKYLVR